MERCGGKLNCYEWKLRNEVIDQDMVGKKNRQRGKKR